MTLSGTQDAGGAEHAPAQNQTGESSGKHQSSSDTKTQSSGNSSSGSEANGKEKTGGEDALKGLSDDGEAGETGGKMDENFVKGVKDKVQS